MVRPTGKTEIAIEVDTDRLGSYSDSYLAMLWHVAQANPADGFEDREPGELAERIGREIIRRWLRSAPVELWHHQGRHYYTSRLRRLGKWIDGVFVPNETSEVNAEAGQHE